MGAEDVVDGDGYGDVDGVVGVVEMLLMAVMAAVVLILDSWS